MKFIKKIFLLLNIGLVIGLAAAYLSPTVDPSDNSTLSLFGVSYPIILIANFVMMLLWMLIDYKYIFISLVTIFFGWGHLNNFVTVNGAISEEKGITVMSYNIHSNYSLRDRDKTIQKQRIEAFQTYLSSLDSPDIICLQEVSQLTVNLFDKRYKTYALHKYSDRRTAIYSRYPIIHKGQVDFKTATNSCLYADIDTGTDTIRVYSAHLKSNQISSKADKVIHDADLKKKKTWESIYTILKRYRSNVSIRSQQVKMVKEHTLKSPYPVVVAGDMNDPPTSYMYAYLSQGLTDAFRAKGNGIGVTYGGSIPMLRIDYILADPRFEILSYKSRKERFSDHYPIFAELKLR